MPRSVQTNQAKHPAVSHTHTHTHSSPLPLAQTGAIFSSGWLSYTPGLVVVDQFDGIMFSCSLYSSSEVQSSPEPTGVHQNPPEPSRVNQNPPEPTRTVAPASMGGGSWGKSDSTVHPCHPEQPWPSPLDPAACWDYLELCQL